MAENLNDLIKKYFRVESDGSITFIGGKLIIQIPELFIHQQVAEIIDTNVISFGIYEGYIFDDPEAEDEPELAEHKFVSKVPNMILMRPTHIIPGVVYVEDPESESMVKEKVFNLVFLSGDTYVASTSLVKDTDNVDKYLLMLLNGKLPKTIRYDEIPILWSKCSFFNNLGDLGSEFNTLSMITSNLVRDPKNLSIPFRLVFDKYYEKGIYVGKTMKYMDIGKHISNFTAITGANPKDGITVAIDRAVRGVPNVKTPVEESIQ